METKTVESTSSGKKGGRICKKHPLEVEYVREELKKVISAGLTQGQLAELVGRNHSNISKFLAGKSRLDDEAIDTLYTLDTVERPNLDDLLPEQNAPLETWTGETKTVAEVIEDKGHSASTIRKYCKEGRLNYVREGRRIMVVIDEKYQQLPEKEIARLRKENAELKERLQQTEFNFDQASDDQAQKDEEDAAVNDQERRVIERYQQTIERLTLQISEMRAAESAERELDEYKQAAQTWAEKAAKLQDKLDAMEKDPYGDAKRINQLMEENKRLTEENEKMRWIREEIVQEESSIPEPTPEDWRMSRGETGVCSYCLTNGQTWYCESGQEFCSDECYFDHSVAIL